MKKSFLFALLIGCVAATTQSCKKMKAGCTDPEAENYNEYAKLGDNSCMYHASSEVTVANWTFVDPLYVGNITWESLTQEVIDRGSYNIFWKDGNSWVELPLAYSTNEFFGSYYQANVAQGQVQIVRYDDDLTTPNAPGSQVFKVVAWW